MADEKLMKAVTGIIEEVCEDICMCDAIREFGKRPLDRLH